MIKTLLLIVHVAAAAVVLGASLGWGRLLRQAAQSGQSAAKVAVEDVFRRLILVRVTSAMTLFTGIGLIFLSGGFGIVPKNFHAALTLMLVSIAWVMLGVAPRVKSLQVAASASDFDGARFSAGIGKVAMGTGVVHAFWLALLTLMFVRF